MNNFSLPVWKYSHKIPYSLFHSNKSEKPSLLFPICFEKKKPTITRSKEKVKNSNKAASKQQPIKEDFFPLSKKDRVQETCMLHS
jgi:hypothetical protein